MNALASQDVVDPVEAIVNTPVKILILVVLISVLLVINQISAQQQDRLQLDSNDTKSNPVEITGVVSKQNKYSIDVVVDGKIENVRIDKQTEFILELSSPRIDFENSKLRIPVRKAQKQFRTYTVKLPLFIRATFAHKNQFNRFKNSPEKRIGNYEISTRQLESFSGDKKRVYLIGKLDRGSDDRNIVLDTGEDKIKIMLAKNGQWAGFSLSDVSAGNTETRIVAVRNTNEETVAKTIFFWPIEMVDSSE